MNSSPLAAIWHWYPLLAWVACARFCSLPLGSLSYLNFYLKLRLDSNFSYGTGLKRASKCVSARASPPPCNAHAQGVELDESTGIALIISPGILFEGRDRGVKEAIGLGSTPCDQHIAFEKLQADGAVDGGLRIVN